MSDFIPNRLNEVPAVFGGCSWEEMGSIAIVSCLVSIGIAILVGLTTGLWVAFLAIILVGTLASVFFGAQIMAGAKRGKPVGYFSTKIAIFKKKLGLANTKIIISSRTWDIGR